MVDRGKGASGEVLHERPHRRALVAKEVVDLGEIKIRQRVRNVLAFKSASRRDIHMGLLT
jgi:hypothetical protein